MNRFRIVLLLLTFICSANLFGQKMPEDYFDEGVEATENNNDSTALSAFYYIVNNHPKNELFPKAYYNIGYTYYKIQDNASAIKIFRNILNGDFNELEPSGRPGIMSDPYANYKHNAAALLAEIYESRAIYDTALFYLFQSDTVYPYEHFCGNAHMTNKISNAIRYANIYEHLNQISNAEQMLLTVSFPSGLADNQEALITLGALFKKHEKPQRLRADLEKSINNYIVDTTYYKSDTSFSYFIFFHGKKIQFYYGGFGGREYNLIFEDTKNGISEREKIIAYLRESELYKIVKKL
jgi:tetratricopeptide (TPR) repeat protein